MEIQRLGGYIAVFVAGFMVCAGVLRFTGGNGLRTPGGAIVVPVSGPRTPTTGLNALPSVAEAVARLEPAVVNIDITGVRERRGPFAFLRGGGSEAFEGAGSGIIVSPDGYVVTNYHVVSPATERNDGAITIKLASGKVYKNISLVGRDPDTDLAVLKIHGARNLPVAEMGDSDRMRVGDWAIAVGNPLGFNSTVTLGIISAVNRNYSRSDTSALDRVIQTDAAINPGNSGGALADISGQVIGINTAIASQNGGSVGIGFAIPINSARRIIQQLIEEGKVTRPYLGIAYIPVDSVEKEALPEGVLLPVDGRGAVIRNHRSGNNAVIPGSPAALAGLREYDVIRAINNRPVDDVRFVRETVLKQNVGDRLTLRIWRNGSEFDVVVVLQQMPENYGRKVPSESPSDFLEPQE